MEQPAILKINDRIAWITMHDAEHFNCLSEAMCSAIIQAIDEAYAAECVGIIITAQDALNVGLVNHIAPEEQLDALLEEKFCAPLRRNSVLSVSAIKRQFRILSRAASTMSSESFERINAYRTKVYRGEDYKEGINSFFEKRPPQYKGKASDLDE